MVTIHNREYGIMSQRKVCMAERVKDVFSGKYGPTLVAVIVQLLFGTICYPWVKDVNLSLKSFGEWRVGIESKVANEDRNHEALKTKIDKEVNEKLAGVIKDIDARLERMEKDRRDELDTLRNEMSNTRRSTDAVDLQLQFLSKQISGFSDRLVELRAEWKQALLNLDYGKPPIKE